MTEVVPFNPPHFRTCVPDIDLGAEGGDGGGEIVAEGTPEQVAAIPASLTGAYLAHVLGIPTAKAS